MMPMPNPSEVSPVIQELRTAMERVRQTQEAAGMVINLARYDAETNKINQDFLRDILGVLPLEPGYVGNDPGRYPGETESSSFLVKDPVNVRIATSFGVFHNVHNMHNGFAQIIIGERRVPADAGQSEILALGWQRYADKNGRWQPATPQVRVYKVSSGQWDMLRDRAISNLSKPYPKESLMKVFNSKLGAFVVGGKQNERNRLDMPMLVAANPYSNSNRKRSVERAYKRSFSLEDSQLGYSEWAQRGLRSTDFEEFDVMRHLEYIAAAFGVGEELDVVKANRESKMPGHPAEELFGLSGYRQAIESQIDLPS